MSRVISEYETVFILNPNIGDENIKSTVDRFTDLIAANGTVIEKNEWGLRKLAYPIQFLNEGYYVLINFTADSQFLTELDRIYNITDSVLRSLVIKKDE
ncbi:MAG: 30S ribosomal protein S6 [Oscillospiraceae bacterium]|nr:30S ribosomal protein S6 [Oscillospiraceae bacterium]